MVDTGYVPLIGARVASAAQAHPTTPSFQVLTNQRLGSVTQKSSCRPAVVERGCVARSKTVTSIGLRILNLKMDRCVMCVFI